MDRGHKTSTDVFEANLTPETIYISHDVSVFNTMNTIVHSHTLYLDVYVNT